MVCPPLVPVGGVRRGPLLGGQGEVADRNLRLGYHVETFSRGLPHAEGGHWAFGAGTAAALGMNLHPPVPQTPPGQPPPRAAVPTRLGVRTLAGQRVNIFSMPPYSQGGGIYGSHVIVQWRRDGTTFQMSLHGSSNERRALLMAEAWILRTRALRRGY